eukprot:1460945-Alexandrium_andersonii.AAC.1
MRFSSASGSASSPTHASASGGHADSGAVGKPLGPCTGLAGIGRSGTAWPNALLNGGTLPSGLCHL